MGEVYRAHDVRLKRDVALKVLPESFAADADRLARFEREAEVLATFNHPNIAQIYGVESDNGVHALAMELVEGPTLSEHIARGALNESEAVAVALQIATALEAAHEKGIVHRDLKPANIKLRSDGVVKVLDFGIAKGLASFMSGSAPTTPALTQTGAVFGTPGYMSPEQLQGKPVDERADIWAFGCVLFEMVTGRPPFANTDDSTAATLDSLPASLSRRSRRTLELCLQKNPSDRIADIRDVKLALQGAFDSKDQVASPRKRWTARMPWLGVGAVLGVVAAWVLLHPEAPSLQLPEMRLQVSTPATQTPLQLALSPDGRHLAFVAADGGQERLWLRPLGATEAQPIAGTEGARYPFWSTDSRAIGYSILGGIYRVEIAGGAPQRLSPVSFVTGGAFNAEGGLLFSRGTSGSLLYLATPGGTATPATRMADGQAGHRFPQFLPDGRRFLFYSAGEPQKAGVFLGSLDGGEPTRLVAADSAAVFAAPHWVLFVQQGSLIARRLDLSRNELTGDPLVVASQVGTEAIGHAGVSASAVGHIAFRDAVSQRSQLILRDRAGAAIRTVAEGATNDFVFPELSPGGRYVATQHAVEGTWDIWSLDLVRGGSSAVTRDPGNEQLPVWSPDGERIVFSSNRLGVNDLYLRNARAVSSAGDPVVENANTKQPQSWSSDGRLLLYYEIGPTTGRDLWWFDFDTKETRVFADTAFEERSGQFSPDGRWVAYETNTSGRYEIVVQSFPQPTTTWSVSTGGGTQPRWSADGTEIFFVAPDLRLMAASINVSPTDDRVLDIGVPAPLFVTRTAGNVLADIVRAQYAVSRDGFLMNEIVEESTEVPVTLILNWRAGREASTTNQP
jgi:Tol biopolymer transport system component